jgi:RNA polymerase sigma-70 factor (ECF subfamily)
MKRDSRQVYTEYLVLQAQGGSESAFRELFELWSADFNRLARVQVRHDDAVEDVTQNAWISIAKGLQRLEDPPCFPSWAFRILHRRSADWIRKQQKDRHRKEVLEKQSLDSNQDSSHADDQLTVLKEQIAQLDPQARSLLHLFYETGLSVAEIDEVLNVPSGTVKSRLYTLRKKLKQCMERIMK